VVGICDERDMTNENVLIIKMIEFYALSTGK